MIDIDDVKEQLRNPGEGGTKGKGRGGKGRGGRGGGRNQKGPKPKNKPEAPGDDGPEDGEEETDEEEEDSEWSIKLECGCFRRFRLRFSPSHVDVTMSQHCPCHTAC